MILNRSEYQAAKNLAVAIKDALADVYDPAKDIFPKSRETIRLCLREQLDKLESDLTEFESMQDDLDHQAHPKGYVWPS